MNKYQNALARIQVKLAKFHRKTQASAKRVLQAHAQKAKRK